MREENIFMLEDTLGILGTGSYEVRGKKVQLKLTYDQIEDKWKKDLELSDVILEIADDLCYGCQMSQDSNYRDPRWEKKYIHMHKD